MILPPPHSDRPDWRLIALRTAIILLLTSLAAGALWLTLLLTSGWPDPTPLWEAFPQWLILPAVIFSGQLLLLAGAPRWTRGRPRRKRAMALSVALFGTIASALLISLLGTLYSAFQLLQDKPVGISFDSIGFWFFFAVNWTFWSYVLWRYTTRDWASRYGRVFRLLVQGTLLELALNLPVDILIRRKSDCYCGEGSAVALAFSLLSAGMLFGPGVVLLMLRRRVQLLRPDVECLQCGYDLRGLPENRCPECGRPFPRPPTLLPFPPSGAKNDA